MKRWNPTLLTLDYEYMTPLLQVQNITNNVFLPSSVRIITYITQEGARGLSGGVAALQLRSWDTGGLGINRGKGAWTLRESALTWPVTEPERHRGQKWRFYRQGKRERRVWKPPAGGLWPIKRKGSGGGAPVAARTLLALTRFRLISVWA